MKTTEGEILRKAFCLFLEKNYERVTVAELEKATGISRGGIFHYMGNKEGLFYKVVDKYVFEIADIYQKLAYVDINNIRLEDFMDLYINELASGFLYITTETGLDPIVCSSNYLKFLFQAGKYYPDFKERMSFMDKNLVTLWRDVVDMAQKKGEIKSDLDSLQVVYLFRYIYFGITYGTYLVKEGNDIKKLARDYNFIYSLIKV